MSDGMKLIAACIAAGSGGTLTAMSRELFEEGEKEVYDFVRQHLRQYRELPQASTVQTEIGRRLPVASEPIDFYVDQVYQRAEYNAIHERFGELRQALSTRDMPAARDSISAMSRATRMQQRQTRDALQMDEAMGLVLDRLEATRGLGGITGIETGWTGFDNITGGYQHSDLISWVGRPSLGKTYLLLKQAEAAHEAGENVLFVTTEMGTEQIARRYASIKTGINPRLLKMNMISTYMERRLRQLYTSMAGAERFKIFSVGMKARINAIEAFMQEFGPSVVFVDGVYLLRPTELGRNMSRVDRITGVYDELKGLNLETETPIVASTQFNRQAGKGGKEGSLENIGYSDAIGTHSSIVVAIKTGPTEDPMASRWMEFLKGREGESGKIAINFKFAPLNMNEFTPEEAEEAAEAEGPNVDWMHG